MPVDYCACVLPLLILAVAILAVVGGKSRTVFRWVAGGLLALFLLIYFVPGWVLWAFAECGNRDAMFHLGNYYHSRLGYMWSDIDARDKWWVEAAKQGHPAAMYHVGYHSMFGTSRHIPKDLTAAREWLEAARAARHPGASSALTSLAEEEAKAAG